MRFDWRTTELKPREVVVPSRLLPGRAPALWLLVPLLFGYALARLLPGMAPAAPGVVACLGAVVALLAALPTRDPPRWRTRLWGAALVVSVAASAALWHAVRLPPPPDRAWAPAREAVLSVCVDELFQGANGAKSGLGTVIDAPAHLAELEGARIQFRVTLRRGESPDAAADLGARVRLRGVLENAPSGDGFARYLRQRGIAFTLSRARVDAVEAPASAFRRACTRARERVGDALRAGVTPEDATRLAALMLGRTALLAPGEREDFRRAGATHLFAISGLHITGIAAGLVWLSRRLRVPDRVAMPVILGGLWLYVQMAGAPPSAMRAWVMAACITAATAAGRGTRALAGLVLAALLTAVAEPASVRDPGFLLSYAVVAALLLYAAPLAEHWDAAWRPWRLIPPDALGWRRRLVLAHKRTVLAAGAVTVAATLAGLPCTAALFGQVSLIGLVANLALVPISGPPVMLGFVATALGVAGAGAWAGPFNAAGALFMRAAAWLAHAAASVPGAALAVTPAPGWAAGVAAAGVVVALIVAPPRPDRSAWRFAVLPVAVALLLAVSRG